MSIVRKVGTTDVSVVIRIIDSTDGTPETAVTSATGGLALEYRREGAVSTAITEADLTNLNDAHSDGGMKHIGNGYYRVDLPDAACASGSTGVLVHGVATGMVVIGEYVQLVAYDPFDTVRLGLTALPNAAADAAGGLPISDAGGLDMDSIKTDTAAILVDTGTDIPATLVTIDDFLDTEIAAIKAKTDQLTFTTANQVDAQTITIATGAIDTTDISAAALNEIADAVLDRNMATGVDSGSTTVRTPRQALRAVRNKVAISAGTATIYKEDDATSSWTAAVTTDAALDPIVTVDPAGP